MLKRQLYEKLKNSLGEYLFGFDEKKLDVGLFSGKVKLDELVFRPDKVNQLLEKHNSPF